MAFGPWKTARPRRPDEARVRASWSLRVIAVPALAACILTGLTPLPALAEEATPSDANPSARDLVIAAGGARYLLSASTDRLASALEPGSRSVVLAALRPGGQAAADPLWSLIATGAVQFRRETAEGGETLWFNPLFDAGLALRWRRAAQGWTVVAAAPVLGETVRGEPEPTGRSAPTPSWLFSTPSIGASLRLSEQALSTSLKRGAWSAALDSPDAVRAARGRVAVERAARGLLSLRGMSSDSRYRTALRTLRLGLTQASSAKPAPGPILTDLAAMGEGAMRTRRPVAAFRRHDGWTVAVESSDAPTVTLLAHYLDPPASDTSPVPPATLQRIDVVRFGVAPNSAAPIGGARP